jgi:hypothetical protein
MHLLTNFCEAHGFLLQVSSIGAHTIAPLWLLENPNTQALGGTHIDLQTSILLWHSKDPNNFSWFCLNEGWSHCAMSHLFPKKLVEVSSTLNYPMLHLGFKISISSILHPNTQCNSLPEFV